MGFFSFKSLNCALTILLGTLPLYCYHAKELYSLRMFYVLERGACLGFFVRVPSSFEVLMQCGSSNAHILETTKWPGITVVYIDTGLRPGERGHKFDITGLHRIFAFHGGFGLFTYV